MTDALEKRLADIASMSASELRAEWALQFNEAAPRFSPNLLRLALAYRLQEPVHGKLSRSAEKTLKRLANSDAPLPEPPIKLKPGTRLLREWNGRMHSVTVREDGFEFDGKLYPSLSNVAKRITGAHWSGPRFFGLKRRPPPPGAKTARGPRNAA